SLSGAKTGVTWLAARTPSRGAHARDGIRAPRCVTARSAGAQAHERRRTADDWAFLRAVRCEPFDAPGRRIGATRTRRPARLVQTPGRVRGAHSEWKSSYERCPLAAMEGAWGLLTSNPTGV